MTPANSYASVKGLYSKNSPLIGKDLKLIYTEVNQNLKIGVGENKVRAALKELEILGNVKVTKTGHNTFVYCRT